MQVFVTEGLKAFAAVGLATWLVWAFLGSGRLSQLGQPGVNLKTAKVDVEALLLVWGLYIVAAMFSALYGVPIGSNQIDSPDGSLYFVAFIAIVVVGLFRVFAVLVQDFGNATIATALGVAIAAGAYGILSGQVPEGSVLRGIGAGDGVFGEFFAIVLSGASLVMVLLECAISVCHRADVSIES